MKVDRTTIIVVVLMSLICVKNAAQGILIPIITQHYTSFNFIVIVMLSQFIIFFFIVLCVMKKRPPKLPEYKLDIVLSGIFSAMMSIFILYSSNPVRTPVFLQCVFQNIPIIPSSIIRKICVSKHVVYKWKFIIPSLLCIFGAIGFSLIPVKFRDGNLESIGWIVMAFVGIICQAGYNVMQERYIERSADFSAYNKFLLMFWSKSVELTTLVVFCWLELFIGYSKHPLTAFVDSVKLFVSGAGDFFMLEGFILAYIMSFSLAVYLNSISTNYNMITVIISNPLATLFFYFFSQFNNGIHYPIWVIICSLVLGFVSIILWLKGETITDYKKLTLNDSDAGIQNNY